MEQVEVPGTVGQIVPLFEEAGGGHGFEFFGQTKSGHDFGVGDEDGVVFVVIDRTGVNPGHFGSIPDVVPVSVGEHEGGDFFSGAVFCHALGGVDREQALRSLDEVSVGFGEAAGKDVDVHVWES